MGAGRTASSHIQLRIIIRNLFSRRQEGRGGARGASPLSTYAPEKGRQRVPLIH